MKRFLPEWDYLIVTASNAEQAAAYDRLIELRKSLGLLGGTKNVVVVADPGGRRVGSGGSTIHCLLEVLNRELGAKAARAPVSSKAWEKTFERLRILIVHAGGDSKRLPPYGPCGKIFIPVPGESPSALGTTLFDRLIPTYMMLPAPESGTGQVVVTSGDVLLNFDVAGVKFSGAGIDGIGCPVDPEVAKNHGVYCRYEDGRVRLFLQKPSIEEMRKKGAVDSHGQAILDIGILNMGPAACVRLLRLCEIREGERGRKGRKPGLRWSGPVSAAIEASGLDLYREVCCALGRETRFGDYVAEVRAAGSTLERDILKSIFGGLRGVPFHADVIPRFRFLHFGTLGELIASGKALLSTDVVGSDGAANVIVNTVAREAGFVQGKNAWVEGCRVNAPLIVPDGNVIVGVDVGKTVSLPPGACLDVLEGRNRKGRKGWFVRIYGTGDAFHLSAEKGGRLGGLPVLEWIRTMGGVARDVWGAGVKAEERAVWNGRFFPFVGGAEDYREWLWLLEPGGGGATEDRKKKWLAADRYSFEEMARLGALDLFHARRLRINSQLAREALPRLFNPESGIAAAELAFMALNSEKEDRTRWIAGIVREAWRRFGDVGGKAGTEKPGGGGVEALELSRILHSLGSALLEIVSGDRRFSREIIGTLAAALTAAEKRWLETLGLSLESAGSIRRWADQLKEAAFKHMSRTIVAKKENLGGPPRNVLRDDEIVWGRAPARLDLGGGWTDTPPYSLERGGCVINAAVNLNGQAPIQAYARVIERREIRINSIDSSTRVVVRDLDDLLDYRKPRSQSALAKAALALAGFSPETARWPARVRTLEGMLGEFGGGIELTTLAAIPSGSGLGTSSIMGAVLVSIIGRVIGRKYTQRELFHAVLQLEQELTTGGGWQDQVGGAVEGVKMISAEKGLVPAPRIHFVPADVLDPAVNGGQTLLYYTGLRRLAKDILHKIVGRYLDRDRGAMATLERLHAFPPVMSEAMSSRDMRGFGALIDVAWRLNVDLDQGHTTPVIEELRTRIGPHIYGAKLLGAGGGGFLLIVCRSAKDAAEVRRMLEGRPPNDKARFFDYSISREGLVVTVC